MPIIVSPYGGTVPYKMTNLPWFTHIHVVPISQTQKDAILKCEECFAHTVKVERVEKPKYNWSKVSSFILHRRKLVEKKMNDWIFILKGTIPLTLSCLWQKWRLD